MKYYRTGIYGKLEAPRPTNVPAREQDGLRLGMARHQRTRSAIAEILGQVCEDHAFSDIRNAQTMWAELSNLIIMGV